MHRSIKEILNNPILDSIITVKGWIRTKRSNGKISFVEINDGSNIKGIQAIIDEEDPLFEKKNLKSSQQVPVYH